MAEIVNLRRARKQMKREQEQGRAERNRLMHGRPKAERQLQTARAEKARRELDGHRLPPRGPA
jgi:Domain of unknown function (DUF4169)